jgi:aldose 1-epimerase
MRISIKTKGFCAAILMSAALAGGVAATSEHLLVAGTKAKAAQADAAPVTIFGVPTVTLTRPVARDQGQPQFVEATVVPSAGMNLLELKARWPGRGEVSVIQSPNISDAKRMLEYGNDEFNDENFKIGGAILLPYPNRIRGQLSPDGKTILAKIAGKSVPLPANSHGSNPGAPLHAMHGLLLGAKFIDVNQQNTPAESSVSANYHAGDFGGHWLSKTDVNVQMALQNSAMDIVVTTKNVGIETLPMAIGFHPYFGIPSGHRQQARLHVPANLRAIVNNYDDVFPRGQLTSVQNSPYDFTAPGGEPLRSLYMDDCFTDLKRNTDGSATIELTDPDANYGLRIVTLSPEIRSVQVYAPLEVNFIAIEPQFNLPDPYNRRQWHQLDTGMASLQPGQSVSWHIRLELFIPQK